MNDCARRDNWRSIVLDFSARRALDGRSARRNDQVMIMNCIRCKIDCDGPA